MTICYRAGAAGNGANFRLHGQSDGQIDVDVETASYSLPKKDTHTFLKVLLSCFLSNIQRLGVGGCIFFLLAVDCLCILENLL